MDNKNIKMRNLILLLLISLGLFSQIAFAEPQPPKCGKEAISTKEAYFKEPKKDVLILIETVYEYDGHVAPDTSKEMTLSMRMGDSSNTTNTWTPFAWLIPMATFDETRKDYVKLTAAERDMELLSLVPSTTICITAQSKERICGLKATVYYAGKEVMVNNSSVGYGMVDITYALPLKEYFEAK